MNHRVGIVTTQTRTTPDDGYRDHVNSKIRLLISRPSCARWLPILTMLTMIFTAGTCHAQATQFKQFGPYELPIPEVANVKVLFETDIDVVIPEFQTYSKADPQLLAYMASGSNVVSDRFHKVVEQTGWGHVVPYFYAAVYHFFGRVYYGISTAQPLANGSSLLPKRTLSAGQIRIRIVSDPDTWQTSLRRLRHSGSGATAYWDPLRAEAGIFIDKSIFHSAAYQARWTGRTAVHNVGSLEANITRLVIREVGHELFHAIQQRSAFPEYSIPLLSEGSALYAQHNSFMREELVRLSKAQLSSNAQSGIGERTADGCPDDILKENWGGDYYSVGELHQAYEYVHYRPDFSITTQLSMNAEEFYGVSNSELSNRYAIALSVYWFLRSIDPESVRAWRRVVSELVKTGQLGHTDRDALGIDLLYRGWIEEMANRWWSNPEAKKLFVQSANQSSKCLHTLAFFPAWVNAVASAAYLPGNPTSPLYLGDLFWRNHAPYDAFEYYKVANAVQQPERYGEYATRLSSRLGDAAEQLGDIEKAMDIYKRVTELPLEDPRIAMTVTRSRLKYEYYRLTEHDGTWLTEQSQSRLNKYVQALQSPSNQKAQEKFLSRTDMAGYKKVVFDQYREVFARMVTELGVKPKDRP